MLESTLGTSANVAFYRNVISLIDKPANFVRPSTTDKLSISNYSKNKQQQVIDESFASLQTVTDNSTFTVLLNEAIKDGTKPWEEYADNLFDQNDQPDPEVWKLLFQLMAAIYAMSLSGLTHNDLHQKNAWIEECDRKEVSYVYGGQTFNFETSYVVKVFDFDRSYNKRLKDNEILEKYCYASQCNKYIPNLDAMKVMGELYKDLENRPICQKRLLNICAPYTGKMYTIDGKNEFVPKTLLKDVWEYGYYLQNPYQGSNPDIALEEKYYTGFSSVFDILKDCARLARINSNPNSATPENTYICNPYMFDRNGKIEPINMSNIMYNEQEILNSKLERQKLIQENFDINQELNNLKLEIDNNNPRKRKIRR
jgi:hypothetical protein